MLNNKARPAAKRRRKLAEKPPMPAVLEPIAEKAMARHRKRHVSPGVAVEVDTVAPGSYVVSSPHSDVDAWQAMICDALGTRSASTAQTFLYELTELCQQDWHPNKNGGGEWSPNERQLNFVLNIVAGIKPRNEFEAALAAQMVAIHMLQMKVSARALRSGAVTPFPSQLMAVA